MLLAASLVAFFTKIQLVWRNEKSKPQTMIDNPAMRSQKEDRTMNTSKKLTSVTDTIQAIGASVMAGLQTARPCNFVLNAKIE